MKVHVLFRRMILGRAGSYEQTSKTGFYNMPEIFKIGDVEHSRPCHVSNAFVPVHSHRVYINNPRWVWTISFIYIPIYIVYVIVVQLRAKINPATPMSPLVLTLRKKYVQYIYVCMYIHIYMYIHPAPSIQQASTPLSLLSCWISDSTNGSLKPHTLVA